MFTSINIENFKSIGKATAFPLRDITLLYGPNSAGKSSIIQALRYAYEVLVNNDPDPMSSNIDGAEIYLGGFRKLVHQRDLSKSIKIGLRFEVFDDGRFGDHTDFCRAAVAQAKYPPNLAKSIEMLRMDCLESTQEVGRIEEYPYVEHHQFGLLPLKSKVESAELDFAVCWDDARSRAYVSSVKVMIDDKDVLVADPRAACFSPQCFMYLSDYDIDFDAQYTEALAHYKLRISKYWDEIREAGGVLEHTLQRMGERARGLDVSQLLNNPIRDPNYSKRIMFGFNNDLAKFREKAEAAASEAAASGESWKAIASRMLENLDRGWNYHQHGEGHCLKSGGWMADEVFLSINDGPELREQVGGSMDNDSWSQQVAAFNTMISLVGTLAVTIRQNCVEALKDLLHVGPLREHYSPAVDLAPGKKRSWFAGVAAWDSIYETDLDVDAISEWLHSPGRFDTGYRVQCVPQKFIPDIDKLKDELTNSPESINNRLDSLPEKIFVTILDRYGLRLQTNEVGTGISQLVPIVVAAHQGKQNTIIFEQPELHLHPKSQLVIADLLIARANAALKYRQFIIETHSEHIALRLLRRIRETSSGDHANSEFSITPDRVAIIYAQPTATGTSVQELRVDETGEFIDRWPAGFFDERAEELF